MAKLDVHAKRTFLLTAYASSQKMMINDLVEMLKYCYSSTWKNRHPDVKEFDPVSTKFKRVPKSELKRLAKYYSKRLTKAGVAKIMKF